MPRAQINKIEAKNAGYIKAEVPEKLKEQKPEEFLAQRKENYYKSACN